MENVIELKNCFTSFEKLERSDCENGVEITVCSDVHDLLVYNKRKKEMNNNTIF